MTVVSRDTRAPGHLEIEIPITVIVNVIVIACSGVRFVCMNFSLHALGRCITRNDASLCRMPVSRHDRYCFDAVLSQSRNRLSFGVAGLSCGVTK